MGERCGQETRLLFQIPAAVVEEVLSGSSEEWPGGLLGRSTYHIQRISGTDLQWSNDLLPDAPRESNTTRKTQVRRCSKGLIGSGCVVN